MVSTAPVRRRFSINSNTRNSSKQFQRSGSTVKRSSSKISRWPSGTLAVPTRCCSSIISTWRTRRRFSLWSTRVIVSGWAMRGGCWGSWWTIRGLRGCRWSSLATRLTKVMRWAWRKSKSDFHSLNKAVGGWERFKSKKSVKNLVNLVAHCDDVRDDERGSRRGAKMHRHVFTSTQPVVNYFFPYLAHHKKCGAHQLWICDNKKMNLFDEIRRRKTFWDYFSDRIAETRSTRRRQSEIWAFLKEYWEL